MRLEYLQDFITLAETMNYEQAAYRLYTSQSTLSKHIQSLEDELGDTLIYHENGRSFLTEFGKEFIYYARKHVELDRSFHARHSASGTSRTVIQLGFESHIMPYNCFEAVEAFQDDYPHCSVTIYDNSTWELLNRGIVDMAIVMQRSEFSPSYDQMTLAQDHFVSAVPCSHELAEANRISIDRLSDEKFILLQKRSDLNPMIKSVCMENGFMPRTVMTLPSCHNVLEMVSKGYGLTILPSKITYSLAPSDTRIVELDEEIPVNINLIYEKNRALTNMERELANRLSEEACK